MLRPIISVFLASSLFQAGFAAARPDLWLLSQEEEVAASASAEKALKDQDLWHGKIYLTNAEVIFDNRPIPPERYALLTFYRYQGDLAILVSIRLDKMIVAKVEPCPHMPTSLSSEEIAEAEKIARAHPEIKKVLARYKHLEKIEADVNVAHIVRPQAPGYQHRVARLCFRDAERNYLTSVPMVDVDLTTGEVRFDLIRGAHDKK
jgi:hypothetical protein